MEMQNLCATGYQHMKSHPHDHSKLIPRWLSFLEYIVISLVVVSADSLKLAIFAPKSCFSTGNIYTQSTQNAIDAHQMSLQSGGIDVLKTFFDSCDEADAVSNMVHVTTSHDYDIIIGPGQVSLCEISARLASKNSITLISWTCMDNGLQNRLNYPTFARSIAPTRETSQSVAKLLNYFEWKYVAIIFIKTEPYISLMEDLYYTLTKKGFEIAKIHDIFLTEDNISDILEGLQSNIKAILLCMDDKNLNRVMAAINKEKLISQPRAFFYLDTFKPLNTSSNLTMMSPLPVQVGAGSSGIEEYLMILKSHSFSVSHVGSEAYLNELSNIDIDFYNAVSMAVQAAVSVVQHGKQITPQNLIPFAQNLTFSSLGGRSVHVRSGKPDMFFSLWDYSSGNRLYHPVVSINASGNDVIHLMDIDWPQGRSPEADTCAFESCEGLAPIYILVIVIVAVVVVGGIITVACLFLRQRLMTKEMEKGPNKIVLTADDLIFFVPKNKSSSRSLYSNSAHMLEKPDLIKGSEPSMSVDTIFGDNMEFGDTARYNGDLVFIKELFVKGFELKGTIRAYVKQLKDLRHENINPFIGCYLDPVHHSFVFEYCNRRSLEDVIANEDIKLDWDFKLSLLNDLVKGMRYLHGSSLKCHGNLRSGNLVIDSRWVLKITDYGVNLIRYKFPYSKNVKAKELLWTAPEVLREPVLLFRGSPKGDVYSFGIIMQEVIIRGHPFCMIDLNAEEIIKKIMKPPPLIRPSVSKGAAPPQYIQIMKQCWSENPELRPNFEEIYQQFKDCNKGRKVNIVDTMFKMLEKYSNDLEEIVRDRTLALEEEKKKTEHLLSQMLPKSVAESLLIGRPVQAEDFADVTIYFSDIVGFTTISAMSTPLQVVDLLNDLYTMFDTAIDLYDVYKVETIGDAYMVVSGLPETNGNLHAGEISKMSLDILSSCGQFKIRHMPDIPLRLRIGLHTGPCVAGVVGLRMPRYCLFGDTVNTASRMESTGTAFRIHISQITKDRLDELGGYNTQYRGEVELKGKGIHKTYWLTGKSGFDKPLPETPSPTGLAAYIDVEKLTRIQKENESNINNSNAVQSHKLDRRSHQEADNCSDAKTSDQCGYCDQINDTSHTCLYKQNSIHDNQTVNNEVKHKHGYSAREKDHKLPTKRSSNSSSKSAKSDSDQSSKTNCSEAASLTPIVIEEHYGGKW